MTNPAVIKSSYPEGYSHGNGEFDPSSRYDDIEEFTRKSGLGSDLDFIENRIDLSESIDRPESLEEDLRERLYLGISEKYLDKLIEGRYIRCENVEDNLKADIISSEGTVKAIDEAMKRGSAYHIGGGHHHASRGGSSDYSFNMINDILVGLNYAKNEYDLDSIMVVDLDLHYGDGTAAGIKGESKFSQLSLHEWGIFPGNGWHDYKGMEGEKRTIYNCPIPHNTSGNDYNEVLAKNLSKAVAEINPDLILYQSGVDPHHMDPKGSLNLTNKDLFERDNIVLEEVSPKPIAVVTGGGYGPESSYAPVNTIAALKNKEILFEDQEPKIDREKTEEARDKIENWYE